MLFLAFTASTTRAISSSGAVQPQEWLLRYSPLLSRFQALAFCQINRQTRFYKVKQPTIYHRFWDLVITATDCWQVHVRFRQCFRPDGSCTCAVVFREDNNVLGINACQPGRPPVLVKYLVDPVRPADDIQISADGLVYIVRYDFRWPHLVLEWGGGFIYFIYIRLKLADKPQLIH